MFLYKDEIHIWQQIEGYRFSFHHTYELKSISYVKELSPQSKEVLGLDPGAAFYMQFERSPHVCVDLLWVLRFPPTDMQRSF